MKKFVLILLVLGFVLNACATSASQPLPTDSSPATNLPQPSNTPAPSPTNTLAPTATMTAIPATPTSTATATPYAAGPVNFPANVNPLTGKPVSDPNLLNRRPMAVKVQLYPRGQRPVWGVSQADMVYDYYQNDGLTRLNAVFYGSDANQIGPVRSARLFDESIIRMYKAIFAFGGAADYVLRRFYNAEYADRLVTESNRNCPPMCRQDPNGFNFLFTSSPDLTVYALEKGISNSRQNLDGITFNSDIPPGGQPGQQIFTRYSISAYNRWDYDPTSGRYLRFQDTQEDNTGKDEAYAPLVDGLNSQQVAADNVVVLYLPHPSTEITGARGATDIQLSGSGQAYAFRDGQAYPVNWNRPTKDSVLFLTTLDGQPFPLKPGATWYQVVGISSQLENPEPGAWRFTFQLP